MRGESKNVDDTVTNSSPLKNKSLDGSPAKRDKAEDIEVSPVKSSKKSKGSPLKGKGSMNRTTMVEKKNIKRQDCNKDYVT